MTFAAPQWLWALALVPAFWWWASSRAGAAGEPDVGGARARWLWVDGQQVRPAPRRPGRRRRGAWASAGLALAVVALAQPQWGEGEVVRFDQGREVLIALDLSRSMLADDVPPSRLDRARLLIASTLDELRGERVGLLLFAGTAFLQSPLSADHEVLRELLPVLEPGYLPQGGTDFAAMIDAALEAFSQTGAADRFLVILSDGESPNFDDDAVDALAEAGVRVIALGIGTEAGALIPDGRGGIVKDARGAAVLSRLERPVLDGLARGTSGVYVDAAQWVDLASLIERTVAAGRAGKFVEERERVRIHRFQWWLAPALALLLASHLFEVPGAPRSRHLHEGRTGSLADSPGVRAGVAALLASALLSGLAPPAVARAAAPPQEPGASPPTDPIVALVEQLASAESVAAGDYAQLARTTVEAGFERLEAGPSPLPPGAIRDALAAVEVGRALDPEAASWDELRAALQRLKDVPPPEQQGGDGQQGQPSSGEESGESGQQGQEQNQQGEQGRQGPQGEQGESGESGAQASEAGDDAGGEGDESDSASPGQDAANEPGSDASSSADAPAAEADPSGGEDGSPTGERERGDPRALADAAAGFGDLDSSDPGDASDEAAGEAGEDGDDEGGDEAALPRPAPSRMVGGMPGANEALMQARPDLANAIGRMERVRDGDAPAVLFDRMNDAEGRGSDRDSAGGQDW